MNTKPLITEFTLSQAQAFILKHQNSDDRYSGKWSANMHNSWRAAWNMVEDHKLRLAKGLVSTEGELKTIAHSAQVISRGQVRIKDREQFTTKH